MTERGIETSKSIKRGFEHANIKIHKVFSSPSCRARETAIYAFGRIDEVHSSLLHYSTFNPLDRQKLAMDLKKTLLEFEKNDIHLHKNYTKVQALPELHPALSNLQSRPFPQSYYTMIYPLV